MLFVFGCSGAPFSILMYMWMGTVTVIVVFLWKRMELRFAFWVVLDVIDKEYPISLQNKNLKSPKAPLQLRNSNTAYMANGPQLTEVPSKLNWSLDRFFEEVLKSLSAWIIPPPSPKQQRLKALWRMQASKTRLISLKGASDLRVSRL